MNEMLLASQTAPHRIIHGDYMARLNQVVLTAAQIEAAGEALALLPSHHRDQVGLEPAALEGYAKDAVPGDPGNAAAALFARLTALAHWQAAHDAHHDVEARILFEATARMPLTDCDGRMGFDPAGFQELMLFIEELPW
jgi:hypothetical protein